MIPSRDKLRNDSNCGKKHTDFKENKWPWTPINDKKTDLTGSEFSSYEYPRISLIIPNYNYGEYLEEAILSVLLQNYPDLELVVIDGGSSDSSVSVIRKYESWITYWESEPDRGQSHALNKGFARCTGQIVNWLCSDDMLKPGALFRVAEVFMSCPKVSVVAGATQCQWDFNDRPAKVRGPSAEDLNHLPFGNPIEQPSCFFRRSILRPTAVREDLHFVMDLELWDYFRSIDVQWRCIGDVLSICRFTEINKTSVGGLRAWSEWQCLYREYCPDKLMASRFPRYFRQPIRKLKKMIRIRGASRVLTMFDRALAGAARQAWGPSADHMAAVFFWLADQEEKQS